MEAIISHLVTICLGAQGKGDDACGFILANDNPRVCEKVLCCRPDQDVNPLFI